MAKKNYKTSRQKHITRLNLISRHENFCAQIRAQVIEDELSEEEAEEHIAAYRLKLLAGLEASFDLNEETDVEHAYEVILFDALNDDVRRKFGYGKAMDRYEETIQNYNNEMGDNVLSFNRNETESVLHNLGRIYFIRQVGVHLGLEKNDIDKIVQNLINKYFRAEK